MAAAVQGTNVVGAAQISGWSNYKNKVYFLNEWKCQIHGCNYSLVHSYNIFTVHDIHDIFTVHDRRGKDHVLSHSFHNEVFNFLSSSS